MKEQMGPKAFLARTRKTLPLAAEQLPELPLLAYRVLNGLDRQTLSVRWRADELERLRREVRDNNGKVTASMSGGALILAGTLLLLLGPGPMLSISVAQGLVLAFYLVGGLFLARRWR